MLKEKVIIFFLLSYSTLVIAQDIQFSEVENLPEARSAVTSANNGESIFVVNGFGVIEQFNREVYQYKLSENAWSILTDATIPKRYASAEIIDDHLYVFNGLVEGGALNPSVEKINLNNGTIEYLSDNPQPSRAGGVSTWNNKIYSFGGSLNSNEYSNKLYEFDPLNDTWTELTEIPFAGETKGEIVDGKLYIIGGYNGLVSSSIDVYDLSSGQWESNIEMPAGISAHATAVIGSKIYLVGDFAILTSVAYFDTFDNSFQYLGSNLMPRRHCAAEGIQGSLLAIGGNTTSNIESALTSVQKADIITSVFDISLNKKIEVFPNPTSSLLNFNLNFEKLVVYNVQGKEIQSFINVTSIDMSNLKAGLYFLKGSKGEVLYQGKFIKI